MPMTFPPHLLFSPSSTLESSHGALFTFSRTTIFGRYLSTYSRTAKKVSPDSPFSLSFFRWLLRLEKSSQQKPAIRRSRSPGILALPPYAVVLVALVIGIPKFKD